MPRVSDRPAGAVNDGAVSVLLNAARPFGAMSGEAFRRRFRDKGGGVCPAGRTIGGGRRPSGRPRPIKRA